MKLSAASNLAISKKNDYQSMKPGIILKEKLNGTGPTLGVLVTEHLWPELIERCQRASLDYLIIDMEHGYHSNQKVAQACQVGRLLDFPVLVRPVSSHPDIVRRVLDFGPCGLMVPTIEGTDQLDEIQSAIFVPPRGERRPGGMGVYWIDKYDSETWKSNFEDHLVVLPQIENQKGLNNVDLIANHEIVTAMAIGPYDLSLSLGYSKDSNNPEFRKALQQVRQAANRVGKKTWIIGNGSDLSGLINEGFSFLCIGEPNSILEAEFRKKVNEVMAEFAHETEGRPSEKSS